MGNKNKLLDVILVQHVDDVKDKEDKRLFLKHKADVKREEKKRLDFIYIAKED